MTGPSQKITCGDFKALRRVITLTGIPGEWTKGINGHRQFYTVNGAVLNYWKSREQLHSRVATYQLPSSRPWFCDELTL